MLRFTVRLSTLHLKSGNALYAAFVYSQHVNLHCLASQIKWRSFHFQNSVGLRILLTVTNVDFSLANWLISYDKLYKLGAKNIYIYIYIFFMIWTEGEENLNSFLSQCNQINKNSSNMKPPKKNTLSLCIRDPWKRQITYRLIQQTNWQTSIPLLP